MRMLRAGTGAVLMVLIMAVGSLVLWLGTPLLWLWVGSQVDGWTRSLGLALLVMAVGVGICVWLVAKLLAFLSNLNRRNTIARGYDDPGHSLLENVLIVTAGIAIVIFSFWFIVFAGAGFTPVFTL